MTDSFYPFLQDESSGHDGASLEHSRPGDDSHDVGPQSPMTSASDEFPTSGALEVAPQMQNPQKMERRLSEARDPMATGEQVESRVSKIDWDAIPTKPLQQPMYPARIAIYDDMAMPPRVVIVEPKDIASYLQEITASVYDLMTQQGGTFPFSLIREIVENYIHASFIEPTISILDHGLTIVFSDQGPGIPNKYDAMKPSFTSATKEMKRYIRGVGSGLPIVEEWLRKENGTISIEDNLGHGTIVTVSLAKSKKTVSGSSEHDGRGMPQPYGEHPAGNYGGADPRDDAFRGQPSHFGYQQQGFQDQRYADPRYAAPQYASAGASGPYQFAQPRLPQEGSYPGQWPGYPQYQSNYPGAGYQSPSGYPQYASSEMGGYPQQVAGHPQQPAGYQQQPYQQPYPAAGYPQQQAGYPPQPMEYPQQQMGYPQGAFQQQDVSRQGSAFPSFDQNAGSQPNQAAQWQSRQWGQQEYQQVAPRPGLTESAGVNWNQSGMPPASGGDGAGLRAPFEAPHLTDEQRAILLLFRTFDQIGPKEVSEGVGIKSPATAHRRISDLVSMGYLMKSGQKHVLTTLGKMALETL